MSNVVELSDPFSYIVNEETNLIESVCWRKGSDIVEFGRDGTVTFVGHKKNMSNHELRQLMIMWLALEHPDYLAFDENEKESKIRAETEAKPLIT